MLTKYFLFPKGSFTLSPSPSTLNPDIATHLPSGMIVFFLLILIEI